MNFKCILKMTRKMSKGSDVSWQLMMYTLILKHGGLLDIQLAMNILSHMHLLNSWMPFAKIANPFQILWMVSNVNRFLKQLIPLLNKDNGSLSMIYKLNDK